MYKETCYETTPVQGSEGRTLGPPSLLSAMHLLRKLDLCWEVGVGEEREFFRCLAALPELERLCARLAPSERVQAASPLHNSPDCNTKAEIGIEVLEPLLRHLPLQELDIYTVPEKYTANGTTWGSIQDLRWALGLPALLKGVPDTDGTDLYGVRLR